MFTSEWWRALPWTAILVGAVALAARGLIGAVIADVAKRIGAASMFIRCFDRLTRWALRDPVWFGEWEVTWDVKSSTFQASNVERVRLYRMFNRITLVASGTTKTGEKIPYRFTGILSRERTLATGLWDDNHSTSGYYGSYQIRLASDKRSASGKWVGFSNTTDAIKTGPLKWSRVS